MSATARSTVASAPTLGQARFEYLLRLGDTSLVLAQRLGEWVGHAPALEEDLGLANVALDLLGQARLLLSYAGELEGCGRDEDALAYRRDVPEFRNFTLVEQPNGDFGFTIVRQFLLDGLHINATYAQSNALNRLFGMPDIDQKFVQGREGLPRFAASDGVDLDPVASGEDDRFLDESRVTQRLQHGWHARLGQGEPLAHRDGRGVVAQADDEEGHGELTIYDL